MLTFRDFLLSEDTAGDIENLRRVIAELNARKAKAVKPIDDQIVMAQKNLAMKVKMLPHEQQKQEADQKAEQAQQTPPAPGQPRPAV